MTLNITVFIVKDWKDGDEALLSQIKTSIGNNAEDNFNIIKGEQKDISDEKHLNSILSQNRTVDSIITIGDELNLDVLGNASFEIRKKWVHLNELIPSEVVNSILSTLLSNIERDRKDDKLFSIFTCGYKTTYKDANRLYQSLLKQDYPNWNWWIIDDSPAYLGESVFEKFKDPRITVIKNVSNHGSIGFNKHMIAMCCDGDYLVEVDHDDELTPDCLSTLYKAFKEYPDSDFVYSDTLELADDVSILYGEGFALGQGVYGETEIRGKKETYSICTPSINAKSIRMIYSEPNHVRCWKKEFYHRIGGHNTELSVLDDMELIIRTFLYGKMTRIPRILYIQHEDFHRGDENSNNTQSKRFKEIQRMNWLLFRRFDFQIHQRILSLGGKDEIWDETTHTSDPFMDAKIEERFDNEL